MVRHPLVPPAESSPGGFLDDGMLVIVSGEAPDRVQAGEPGDGGEHDFPALAPAQEPGTAEPADCPQMFGDLRFVVTLVSVSGRLRRPSAPYPRIICSSFHGALRRPGRNMAGVARSALTPPICRNDLISVSE